MPAKKAKARAQASSEDVTRMTLKWLYVGGAIVAGVLGALQNAGVIASVPFLSWILILIGLAAGFFYHDYADVMNFGLRYVIVWVLANATPQFLESMPAVQTYVGGFLTGFVSFLGPVVLAMAILHFSNKYFGSSEA